MKQNVIKIIIKQFKSVRAREKNQNAYGQKEKAVFFPLIFL